MTKIIQHQDTLFQKQKRLEGYLLRHPNSTLFAWYANQNMEIGRLDRAERICKLGLTGQADAVMLHKLLGDIYLAQGRTDEARREYALVLQSHRPFPSVVQQYLKQWKDDLSPQEETALMRRLAFTTPGNPDVVKFYKLHRDNDRILTRPDRRDFLSDNKPVTKGVADSESVEHEAPNQPIDIQVTPEPADSKHQKITKSMATFTLMQIFKDQGLYSHALEVLEILRKKSPNTERVEAETKEIKALIAQQSEGQPS